MWKGWIIEESLSDPAILSEMKLIHTETEENDNSGETVTWTIHTVEVPDNKMTEIAKKLEKLIEPTWYTHFMDMKTLIVIFSGKSFRIRVSMAGKDRGNGITEFKATPLDIRIWKDAVEYGTKKGKVDSRYMLTVN